MSEAPGADGRYRAIVESAIDFAIVATDREGRVTQWNSGAEQVLGWLAAEMLDETLERVFTPEDRAAGRPATEMRLALVDGREADERWHVRKDGSRFWASGEMMPLRDEAGEHQGFVKILRDRTAEHRAGVALREAEERRRASEARLLFLDRLAQATQPLTDPVRIMATTARLVGEHLGVSICAYADMDADQDGFTIRGDWAAPGSRSIVGRYCLADFGRLAVKNLGAGLPLVVHDNLRELAPEEAATFQAIGITATICMPLVKDGRLAALMAVHDRAPRDWTEAELGLVREVTARSWAHVERVAAEAAVRDSEAQFRLMADAVPQIVWITDVEGRTEFFNRQWTEYTGAPFEPSTAADVAAAHVHPDDQAATVAAFDEARRLGRTFQVEHRIRSAAGEWRWFLVRAEPHRDPSTGAIVRWVGSSTDIQEIVMARQVLARAREELGREVAARTAERDLLWSATQDIQTIIDEAGVFHAINPAFTGILGWSEAEVVGRTVFDFIVPEDDELTNAALEQARRSTLPVVENRYRHKDGGFRWISWVAAPSGGLIYASGRHVTEQKEQAAALAQAEEALRQAQKMEAMGQLTGGVAHDFNNLLTPIIGSLDRLVTRGVGTERERRLMAGALESAERARVLVQRLLAFARRQPLQPVAVDVGGLVESMVGLIGSTLGPKISVRVELAEALPPAKADPNQLEMALLNLAVNARDAMSEGGTLTLAASRDSVRGWHRSGLKPGHYVRLSVADTGTGMDEATRARAVEPFFSTKGIGKGTGLGLSMVHGLAAQLGGGLSIRSAPGQGTTVELWLPISAEPVDGAEADRTDVPRFASHGCALLVDDEDLVRMSTADMLGDLGFEVLEAGSAEEALRLLREGRAVDLLVTDHLMPGMSGADLAREARALRPGLPVLIVSGYAEVEGIAPGLPRLVKPFRVAELAERVASIMPHLAYAK